MVDTLILLLLLFEFFVFCLLLFAVVVIIESFWFCLSLLKHFLYVLSPFLLALFLKIKRHLYFLLSVLFIDNFLQHCFICSPLILTKLLKSLFLVIWINTHGVIDQLFQVFILILLLLLILTLWSSWLRCLIIEHWADTFLSCFSRLFYLFLFIFLFGLIRICLLFILVVSILLDTFELMNSLSRSLWLLLNNYFRDSCCWRIILNLRLRDVLSWSLLLYWLKFIESGSCKAFHNLLSRHPLNSSILNIFSNLFDVIVSRESFV